MLSVEGIERMPARVTGFNRLTAISNALEGSELGLAFIH